MAWVETKKQIKVGDWVETKMVHKHPWGTGYFERGSLVKVTAIDPMRGYTIEDGDGHRIAEIGWII